MSDTFALYEPITWPEEDSGEDCNAPVVPASQQHSKSGMGVGYRRHSALLIFFKINSSALVTLRLEKNGHLLLSVLAGGL